MRNCSIYCRLFLLVLFSITPIVFYAQSHADRQEITDRTTKQDADTATISFLKKEAERYMDKPGANPEDMQMASFIAGQIETLSLKLKYTAGTGISQLLFAKVYRQMGEAQKARAPSLEAVRILSAYGTPQLKAEALIELGGTYGNTTSDLPVKIRLYEEGTAIFAQLGNTSAVAQLKEFIGDLLQFNRQYDQAIKVLNESLSLYKKTGYKRLHGVYSLLGLAYQGANNFVESLRYNLMALQTGDALHEQGPLMVTIYNRVGLNYQAVQYDDQAIGYYKHGLILATRSGDTAAVKQLLLNMADALYNKGEYRQSLDSLAASHRFKTTATDIESPQTEIIYLKNYLALRQYHMAEQYYRKLAALYERPDMSESVKQTVRLNMVSYLQATGQFGAGIPLLDQFDAWVPQTRLSLPTQIEGEYLAYRADSALGNAAGALLHFRNFKSLSDSMTNITRVRQMGILQLQFETEQKDKNIKLLTQKNQLQEATIRNAAALRNVIVGSICMLIVFLALLYNRYRLKKRTNIKLVAKQDEINRQNEALKKLIDDREWLLREVHHRVKNNLQIVISLLNSQCQYLDSQDAIAAIENSQHRMHAMSLIHQRLYQTENLGSIDMNWYISELMSYMRECFETESKIRLIVKSDHVLLDPAQAVPLGLILNEAVSNAMKHAFPGNRHGTIEVIFERTTMDQCTLSIRDNGIGFEIKEDEHDSLGMSLMRGLAGQLDGDFLLESGETGVAVAVRFKCRTLHKEPLNLFQ